MKLNDRFRNDTPDTPKSEPEVVHIGIDCRGAKFALGEVTVTDGVKATLCPECVGLALSAHVTGDWGPHLSKWDKLANDDAVKRGGRILSKWHGNDGVAFYIVTEADRSRTTLLLVEEY